MMFKLPKISFFPPPKLPAVQYSYNVPCPSQAARQGLEQSNQQLSAASTDRGKAEAQVAVELYEALVKALEN